MKKRKNEKLFYCYKPPRTCNTLPYPTNENAIELEGEGFFESIFNTTSGVPMTIYDVVLLFCVTKAVKCDLWAQIQPINDLRQFRSLVGQYRVPQSYMEDSYAKISVFAPVDQVFNYNADIKAQDQKQVLSHFVDVQVPEILMGKKWDKQTLIRTTVTSGKMFITQFEHNTNNFSYFANNGRLCNHVSSSWAVTSGDQYLFKVCTPIGHRGFPGTALSMIRMDDISAFRDLGYDNSNLRELRDILERIPDVSLVVYGASAWNGFHTFFLPTDQAFSKVADRRNIDREVLLAHVTGTNRVFFTEAWNYDFGVHYYPSILFASNLIEDNFKLKLSIRNITDRKSGRWEVYAVSNVYERFSTFRRGSVWAKIITPNIPVENGVAHIIDTVLGVVSNSIDQMLYSEPRCTTLTRYINTIGNIIRAYFSAQGGLVTFFAPTNEAFDRIPEDVERRILRDRVWLERILKLHIVPGKEFTSDLMTNNTIVNTVDNLRRLYFIKGEWPINNITYYVLGGGVRAAIIQEDVSATNGIIHYIDRVLGVPYQTMWDIIRNETQLQLTYRGLEETQLKYTLDPWEVVRSEQNFTFFVPTNAAWEKVAPFLRQQINDDTHVRALAYVYKRHIIQGQALMLTDLRERTYVAMNDEKIVLRRRGRFFEVYWPYGNMVGRLVEGGEIAARNGFMHMVDNILLLPEDLDAGASTQGLSLILFIITLMFTFPHNLLPNRMLFVGLWIVIALTF